jgi:hypothetical protein
MNTTENFPLEDDSLLVSESVIALQKQLNESFKQLSPDRLRVLADFAAYLANAESEAATQELLAISGLFERVNQNQATPKTEYVNWKTVRSDV